MFSCYEDALSQTDGQRDRGNSWPVLCCQDSQFVVDDMSSVMSADAALSTHPVVVPLSSSYQIMEAFDLITYSKVQYITAAPLTARPNAYSSRNRRRRRVAYVR